MAEASNQAIVVASPPPDPAFEVESPLSDVLYDSLQQVQAGMEDLLRMISEIDAQSAEVVEEIGKCKENAYDRTKAIEDEKDRFQKAAYAVLDVLNFNTGDGQTNQMSATYLGGFLARANFLTPSWVIYNRDTDQSRGFGFVTMSTEEEAEKAVEMFNRFDLNGRYLTVNKAAPRGTAPERPVRTFEPSFRIYVGNLPWDVDNARLEDVFSQYGEVLSARVVFGRETGRSRGFGFVTMSYEKDMNDAIAALDGQSVDGRTIRVNIAEE